MAEKIKLFIGTLSTGGAERVVSNLSLHMPNKVDKEIILFGSGCKVDYPYNGKLVYLDKIQHKNLFCKIYAFFFRIKKIKEIKKHNPNVAIISFLEYPNLINLLSKKHGKTIISVRNHMSTKHNKGLKSYFWNNTIKYLYGKADKVIVVSKEIKRDLIYNYGLDERDIKVIYNSYPIEEIEKLSQNEIEDEYKIIFNNPVIITAGRLNKQKGQWNLIRAFSKVKDSIPNAKLVILGKGELEKDLKKLAMDFNMDDDVHFLGFQQNPFKYISKSKIFVLSSFHEGFPNAMAEAMACGVPIISTDCLSGPREILAPDEFGNNDIKYDLNQNRYGILVPVCDGSQYGAKEPLTKEEKIMANHIITLLKDEELKHYFCQKSLKRIKDFDIKNIIKEWESII
ncbi:glycosyltransferase [Clostridium cochlearium]|uniref:Glycosyltransferase n=1 Tax=Clostridium cochlearium TaxID=1494 RepID=A0A7Y3XYK4_CLOCO|nr:glycosyltransferase [Clostridium cochlearium]NOH16236.1 glycosyltransferase [Clostridium cochlearium]